MSTEVLDIEEGDDVMDVFLVTTFTDSTRLVFKLLENNTLAVYRLLDKEGSKYNVCIPKTVDYNSVEYLVTGIWDEAFSNFIGLTSVTIPNSVNIIGNSAFYGCTGLTSIEIPNSVNAIYPGAFYGCSGLTSIEIPNSVNAIGDGAFYGCSGLTSIEIPNSVNAIYDGAFYGCSGLTSIEIPNSVNTIGNGAFCGCINLTSVSIQSPGFMFIEDPSVYITHKELNSIFDNMFPNCNKLQRSNVKMAPGYIDGHLTYVDESKKTLIRCSESVSGHLTLPNTVTCIRDYAFSDCSSLTSVTIPNSVTSIGGFAFDGCSGLTSVTIPNSVTSIGDYAFSDCSGLTSVTIPNSVTSIGEYAFYRCSGLTSVEIPNSMTAIAPHTFENCGSLTSLTIPNSVTSIGEYAFVCCSGLISVTIGNSVMSIGECAFLGCSGLTSINIPDSVTEIGKWAFEGCSGLTSVTIPNSVTSIGEDAFNRCSGLTSVTIPNPVFYNRFHIVIDKDLIQLQRKEVLNKHHESKIIFTQKYLDRNSWDNSLDDCIVASFDDRTKIMFKLLGNNKLEVKEFLGNPNNKKDYIGDVCIPMTVEHKGEKYSVLSIGEGAFEYCCGLTSLTIPNSVVSIGSSAFDGCRGLTSVTIPNSVASIGGAAFYRCSGLTSVTIPNSVTSIRDNAFEDCSCLTSVNIPNSVTSIGYSAFSGCSRLTSATIPNSVTSIDAFAFQKCTSLTSVTIPNSVTSIGNYAFDGVNNIVYSGSATGAPWGAQSLNKIVMDDSGQLYESYENVGDMSADYSPRIYSNSNDGYVNIRQSPESTAPILGVLRNGSEGAILLGTEGEWKKIDCNGIVGYVYEKYVQDSPTEVLEYWGILKKDASNYRFTENDLSPLTAKELTYLRNSVYAKHGYVFNSQELNNYFKQFSWYHPNPNLTDAALNSTEKENVEFIRHYQEQTGKTYKPQ